MILCTLCKGPTKVTDSRDAPAGTRRRHQCNACGHRITTMEQVVYDEGPGRPIRKAPQPYVLIGINTGGPGG